MMVKRCDDPKFRDAVLDHISSEEFSVENAGVYDLIPDVVWAVSDCRRAIESDRISGEP